MTILNTNKLTFFQNEGAPLKSGYVYVGQPGLDPLVPSNQKTVTFTDSAGSTFTATQPLRTNTDGRIQWNGKAITANVTGDYSLLILNSNKVQINGGWTPTVSNTAAAGGAEGATEVRLTLAEIKTIDVSVGDTVENVGKLTAQDTLGAVWLAVSATGGAADDIDLIDFDNGLQGQRVKNFRSEAATTADKAAVRTNIDVYSKSEIKNRVTVYSGQTSSLDMTTILSDNGEGFYLVTPTGNTNGATLIYLISGVACQIVSDTRVRSGSSIGIEATKLRKDTLDVLTFTRPFFEGFPATGSTLSEGDSLTDIILVEKVGP